MSGTIRDLKGAIEGNTFHAGPGWAVHTLDGKPAGPFTQGRDEIRTITAVDQETGEIALGPVEGDDD